MTQVAPLSFNQESLWLTDELVPGVTQYVLVWGWSLAGDVDVAGLTEALRTIVRRHDVLRCALSIVDGQPAQTVRDDVEFDLGVANLSELPEADRDGAVRALVGRWFTQRFDLAAPPLLHAELLRLEPRRHLLVLVNPHVIWDEGSQSVLVRELAELYDAHVTGRRPRLPQLAVQYADFAVWQREELEPELEAGLRYWADRLAGAPTLPLPVDRSRPAVRCFVERSCSVPLPDGLVRQVTDLARSAGATPFMVWLAAFDALLARWTAEPDVVLGVPVFGRGEPEVADLLGLFVNTVVARTRVAAGEPFADLLRRVQDDTAAGFAHQEVPFHRIVERLNPPRDLSRHPLYQVAFQVVPDVDALHLTGLEVTDVSEWLWEQSRITTEFDLVANVWMSSAGGPRLEFLYAEDLFDAATMRRLAGDYLTLLRDAVTDPRREVGSLGR